MDVDASVGIGVFAGVDVDIEVGTGVFVGICVDVAVGVSVGVTTSTNSYDPISQWLPCGRVTPFCEVLLTGAAAHQPSSPALMAGLPGNKA